MPVDMQLDDVEGGSEPVSDASPPAGDDVPGWSSGDGSGTVEDHNTGTRLLLKFHSIPAATAEAESGGIGLPEDDDYTFVFDGNPVKDPISIGMGAPNSPAPDGRTGESQHYSFRWWYDYSSDGSAGTVASPEEREAAHVAISLGDGHAIEAVSPPMNDLLPL